MAKKFNDRPNWTFGMELEMSCSVETGSTYSFLIIKNAEGKKVMEVSGDMGSSGERRVEIATSPIMIADEQGHRDNMKLIRVLKELFMTISNSDGQTMQKQKIVELFHTLADAEKVGNYTCEVLTSQLKIIERWTTVTVSGEQISFGVPMEDVDYFLRSIGAPWYEMPEQEVSGTEDWKHKYALCVIEKLLELWTQQRDISSPQMKNMWFVMPRNPIAELWNGNIQQGITENEVMSLFEEKYGNTVCKEVYDYLCKKNAVGGHEKNIVRIGNQLVFECRSIPSELREYYFEY